MAGPVRTIGNGLMCTEKTPEEISLCRLRMILLELWDIGILGLRWVYRYCEGACIVIIKINECDSNSLINLPSQRWLTLLL